MLRLAIITVCALIITTDHIVSGYTITSRSRDYTNGYSNTGGSTTGFVGLSKESHADLADQLSSSSAYIPSNSQRYSTVGGSSNHASPATSFASASYTDSAQSNGYASHSGNTPDALNGITNSYTSDIKTSSDTSPPGYATVSSNSDGYSSGSGHGAVGFSGYAGSQSASAAGLSGSDHPSSVEYNSPSSSSYSAPSSSLNGYVIAGPKTAAYTASSSHSHANSPFASNHNFMTSGHSTFPASTHSNSYPGTHLNSYPGSRYSIASYPPGNSHSSHNSYADGPRFTASSLASYLSPHSSGGPSNFVHSSATSPHRSSIPTFMLGASSNINPAFSKGSGSFYPGPGAFSKSGNKFIIIKEGPGNHAALMHPGEPSFPTRMFSGTSGFKVKSAGPFASGPHPGTSNFASGLHLSPGYPGAGGGQHSSAPTNSYFAYQ